MPLENQLRLCINCVGIRNTIFEGIGHRYRRYYGYAAQRCDVTRGVCSHTFYALGTMNGVTSSVRNPHIWGMPCGSAFRRRFLYRYLGYCIVRAALCRLPLTRYQDPLGRVGARQISGVYRRNRLFLEEVFFLTAMCQRHRPAMSPSAVCDVLKEHPSWPQCWRAFPW